MCENDKFWWLIKMLNTLIRWYIFFNKYKIHNGSSSFLEFHMIFTCLSHQKDIKVLQKEGETEKVKE